MKNVEVQESDTNFLQVLSVWKEIFLYWRFILSVNLFRFKQYFGSFTFLSNTLDKYP
jgi:hypothetical protein